MADSRKSGKWRAVMKKTAVRHTLKAVSAVFKCLMTILLIGVITATMVGCVMVVYVMINFKDNDGIPTELGQMSMKATTTVEVQNDKGEWEVFQQLKGTNSIWVDGDEIPQCMKDAVVAIEDERFYDHYGVDWKRTISAFANLIFHFSSTEYGGSTITQQLIKITTQDDDHSIERKITEILRAIEMEKNYYTKPEILEAYLNNLPLTGDIVGVGAGAQYYFGKDVRDLSIAEAAVIASITQNPSKYNPYTRPENIRARQRLVLQKMYELEFITEEEYKQARGEELHFKNGLKHAAVEDYYMDLLVEDVIADLMDVKGYTYRMAQNMVYHGGLTIRSAEKPAQQKAVEEIYANEKNFPKSIAKDKEDPQAAIFIMDYSGRVVATVGGRGEKTADRVLNRSTQSKRQPGSSMKPVSVYGPGIFYNVIHYSSLERDAWLKEVNGKKWPVNYRKKAADNGNVLLNYAVQESLNTVAVRVVEKLTPQKAFDFATNTLHLSTLVKSRSTDRGIVSDIDLAPMGLGGLTDGVYARDMAAAYAVYGGGGQYNKPYTYYEVSRAASGGEKEILLQKGPQNIQTIDEGTAYVMNRILQQVITKGTGYNGVGNQWKGWEVFGKTGTTSDDKDVYFCGGTAYYVGASWFGYDYNKSLNSSQTLYAKKLWSQAMKALHKGLEPKSFDKKGNTQELQYCTQTGLIATAGCPKATGVYKSDNIPGTCNVHGGGSPAANPPAGTTQAGATTTSVPATTSTPAATTTKAPEG